LNRYFIGFGILVLASLACQTLANPRGINTIPTGTVLATSTPGFPSSTTSLPTIVTSPPSIPSATLQAEILFEDDFSSPFSDWSTGDDGDAKLAIEDGAFHIQVNITQNLYWTTPGVNFSDIRIEVDAEKLAGPDSAEYGVICRYDETNGLYNFYYLVIAGDTYAAIIKVVNGEQLEISTRDLTFDAIHSGNASNHITAECVGSRLSLSANGTELFSITDDSHTSGDVGLIATTYEEGGIDVRFDNFVVTVP
jgi:hypothetical protein